MSGEKTPSDQVDLISQVGITSSSPMQEYSIVGSTDLPTEEITFNGGETDLNQACGSVEWTDSEESRENVSAHYSGLFGKMGKEKQDWDPTGTKGSLECSTSSKKGKFPNQTSESKKYLGLCSSSSASGEEGGIEIDNKNDQDLKIKLCNQSCWSELTTSEITEKLSIKNENGREVKFKKQKTIHS